MCEGKGSTDLIKRSLNEDEVVLCIMHKTEGTSPNLLQVMLRDERVLLAMSICVVGGEEEGERGEEEGEERTGGGRGEEEGEEGRGGGRERRGERRGEEEGNGEEVTINYSASCIVNHLAKKHVTSERAGAEGSPMLLLPRLRVVRVVFLRRAFRIG